MLDANQSLLHCVARGYTLCLADFPPNLKPEYLETPAEEQNTLFSGLTDLHGVIGSLYRYFTRLEDTGERWKDRDSCVQAIEAPVKLLWALGVTGQLLQDGDALVLRSTRADLDQALKHCSGKDPARAFAVLKQEGFTVTFEGADGLVFAGGYKQCSSVSIAYPADNHALLRALIYYAPRLPRKSYTQKGIIFEVFLRADLRPLLPGYRFRMPHLPAEEKEVVRTFPPATLQVWQALTGFMSEHYPQYHLYFRVPNPGGTRWVADYSQKDGDYGLWSIFVDETGLSVRIVFNEKNRGPLFDHLGDFSPRFQEDYLVRVACKDCTHCGKHFFFQHGDHTHRLCKTPWYASPPLKLEDLPDIERLVDYRLAR